MLPKKFRLTVDQFNQIPQKSNDFNAVFLNIKFKKGENSSNPKVSIIVPKKIDKRTAVRHLTKRIVAEAIRKKLESIKEPAKLLVKARKVIRRGDRQNLEEEINILLKKANLI